MSQFVTKVAEIDESPVLLTVHFYSSLALFEEIRTNNKRYIIIGCMYVS
jgi:predicted HAD superfamily hydrolase